MSITRILCNGCKCPIAWCKCDIDYRDPDNRFWELSYDPLIYDNDTAENYEWKEHNHKSAIKDCNG